MYCFCPKNNKNLISQGVNQFSNLTKYIKNYYFLCVTGTTRLNVEYVFFIITLFEDFLLIFTNINICINLVKFKIIYVLEKRGFYSFC